MQASSTFSTNRNSDMYILALNIKCCQALYNLRERLRIQAFMKVSCPNYPKGVYRSFLGSSALIREELRGSESQQVAIQFCDMCNVLYNTH